MIGQCFLSSQRDGKRRRILELTLAPKKDLHKILAAFRPRNLLSQPVEFPKNSLKRLKLTAKITEMGIQNMCATVKYRLMWYGHPSHIMGIQTYWVYNRSLCGLMTIPQCEWWILAIKAYPYDWDAKEHVATLEQQTSKPMKVGG